MKKMYNPQCNIHCLAKKTWSFRLGTASQQSSGMYWMIRFMPSMDFFPPDGSGIFQDDNGKIHQALVVKERSMRTHEYQGTWGVIFIHEFATRESCLYPIKSLWDVLEKTEGMVWLSSIQNLGQKWIEFWMEINIVTLHKVVETMPQQMCSVIKAKGGPTKY